MRLAALKADLRRAVSARAEEAAAAAASFRRSLEAAVREREDEAEGLRGAAGEARRRAEAAEGRVREMEEELAAAVAVVAAGGGRRGSGAEEEQEEEEQEGGRGEGSREEGRREAQQRCTFGVCIIHVRSTRGTVLYMASAQTTFLVLRALAPCKGSTYFSCPLVLGAGTERRMLTTNPTLVR